MDRPRLTGSEWQGRPTCPPSLPRWDRTSSHLQRQPHPPGSGPSRGLSGVGPADVVVDGVDAGFEGGEQVVEVAVGGVGAVAGGDPALVVAVVEVADLDGQGESASAGVDVEDFGGGEGVEFVEDAVGEAALVEASAAAGQPIRAAARRPVRRCRVGEGVVEVDVAGGAGRGGEHGGPAAHHLHGAGRGCAGGGQLDQRLGVDHDHGVAEVDVALA